MKKNNPYITDDEMDLGDLVRTLWREKILILSISVICGLLGYLYASFKPKEFKAEITLRKPPIQLFEPYSGLIENNLNNNNNNNNNNNSIIIVEQFIYDFKLKLLSLDNLESFVEESRDLDNFKAYLKSKNITVKKYFEDKLDEVKKKNIINLNKYFLVFTKELDGDIFLNNYVEFTKKKNIIELKKNLKITIENKIISLEQALETAKSINLENPIIKSPISQAQVVNEPNDLFYKGSKVLSQNIIYFKKLAQRLENDQFNYNPILDKASLPVLQNISVNLFFVFGLFLGFLLSLLIIFLRNTFKEKL
jgi:LPS O-antigen subunit length determinant protein (WzzB/FepE family)